VFKKGRQELSERLSLPLKQILLALSLCDLVRINGVGPAYARILIEMGIQSSSDYLCKPSADILERFQRVNEAKHFTKARLGIKDVEYCKRFCRKLDVDIEW